MSPQEDKQQAGELDQMSEELARSLQLCHSIINDYRSKLKSRELKSRTERENGEIHGA